MRNLILEFLDTHGDYSGGGDDRGGGMDKHQKYHYQKRDEHTAKGNHHGAKMRNIHGGFEKGNGMHHLDAIEAHHQAAMAHTKAALAHRYKDSDRHEVSKAAEEHSTKAHLASARAGH